MVRVVLNSGAAQTRLVFRLLLHQIVADCFTGPDSSEEEDYVNDTQVANSVIGRRHHRFFPHLPPRLILLAGALLVGSLLAVFGSLLLQVLRTAGR